MGFFALCDFAELVDKMSSRRSIRVAHSEIDDVFAAPARLCLQIIDDIEDVRWKSFDAGKFVHRNTTKIFMENAPT